MSVSEGGTLPSDRSQHHATVPCDDDAVDIEGREKDARPLDQPVDVHQRQQEALGATARVLQYAAPGHGAEYGTYQQGQVVSERTSPAKNRGVGELMSAVPPHVVGYGDGGRSQRVELCELLVRARELRGKTGSGGATTASSVRHRSSNVGGCDTVRRKIVPGRWRLPGAPARRTRPLQVVVRAPFRAGKSATYTTEAAGGRASHEKTRQGGDVRMGVLLGAKCREHSKSRRPTGAGPTHTRARSPQPDMVCRRCRAASTCGGTGEAPSRPWAAARTSGGKINGHAGHAVCRTVGANTASTARHRDRSRLDTAHL
jgi:hypothetical protein